MKSEGRLIERLINEDKSILLTYDLGGGDWEKIRYKNDNYESRDKNAEYVEGPNREKYMGKTA